MRQGMTKQTTIGQVLLLFNTLDLRARSNGPMAGEGQFSLLRHCNLTLYIRNVCQQWQGD